MIGSTVTQNHCCTKLQDSLFMPQHNHEPAKQVRKTSSSLADKLGEGIKKAGWARADPATPKTISVNKSSARSIRNGRPEASAKKEPPHPARPKEAGPRQPARPGPSPRLVRPPGKPPAPTPGQGPPPASPASFLWEVRLLSCPPPSGLCLAGALPPGTVRLDRLVESGAVCGEPHTRGCAQTGLPLPAGLARDQPPARPPSSPRARYRHQYVLDKSCQV